MTAPQRKTAGSLLLALVGALAGCTSYFEIPIETPIQPKLDITAFQRVLVAGFVAGGDEEVDANLETVRLLRSQLRQKGSLRVIEAEALPLAELAGQPATPPTTSDASSASESAPPAIKEEKDLDPNIRRLQDELSEKLGAPVQIQHGGGGKGKVVVRYHSLDELDGILAHIR